MLTFKEFYLTLYSEPVKGERLDHIQQQQLKAFFLYVDYVMKEQGLT